MVSVMQGGQIDGDGRVVGLASARLESSPWKHLQLGADVAWRPYRTGSDLPKGLDPLDAGWAWSADALLQFKRWEARAEVMAGDRTDRESHAGPNAGRFLGAWGLLAWRWPTRTAGTWMPAGRLEWLDADRTRAGGGHWWWTAALDWEIDGRLRIWADWTRERAQADTRVLGSKHADALQTRDFDRVVLQLQVAL